MYRFIGAMAAAQIYLRTGLGKTAGFQRGMGKVKISVRPDGWQKNPLNYEIENARANDAEI